MKTITIQEVMEKHGGVMPDGCVLGSAAPPPPPPSVLPPPAAKGTPKGGGKPGDKPKGKGDRWGALNSFIDVVMRKLTPAERDVWLILFRDTKRETGTARTGQADIATRAGLKPRIIKYAVASLKRKKLLEVVTQGRSTTGITEYRVRVAPL